MPGKMILLVEDDPNDVLLLQRAFARHQLAGNIHAVNNGEEAIAYLNDARRSRPVPGVILLDLSLPRLSGFEVLSWLRQQPLLKPLPVVVLTSSKDQGDVDRAYELGANSYLVKTSNLDGTVDVARLVDSYWVLLNRKPSICEA
ncbi:MAG: response regulator [Acidobacteria bacterium]|nr:response regulator [Acidobacteriota bacterium]